MHVYVKLPDPENIVSQLEEAKKEHKDPARVTWSCPSAPEDRSDLANMGSFPGPKVILTYKDLQLLKLLTETEASDPAPSATSSQDEPLVGVAHKFKCADPWPPHCLADVYLEQTAADNYFR